jgi:protein phosphatase
MGVFEMRIEIPETCVAALIGISGSGKSTFCEKHFQPTEVLSSDHYRSIVSDDESNQDVSKDAFDALFFVAGKRLDNKRLVVIDATNLSGAARHDIIHLAKSHETSAVALVLNTPEEVCRDRNSLRETRVVETSIISKQTIQLKNALPQLSRDGFSKIYIIADPDEPIEVARTKLSCNKRDEPGPFDIIGDIHGCYDELAELLEKLGYAIDPNTFAASHPDSRKAVFLGDFCGIDNKNVETLRLVMSMAKDKMAFSVCGHHDAKLERALRPGTSEIVPEFQSIAAQLRDGGPDFRKNVKQFIDSLPSHLEFDCGNLVVAHAGILEKFHGRVSSRIRAFCLNGDLVSQKSEFGSPVRFPWADNYQGKALVVYGHTPVPEPKALNNTICIDTGCAFGGKLTAYRYPEGDLVSVPSRTSSKMV